MNELLESYKEISIQILEALKSDNVTEAKCKLEKRESIIKDIQAQDIKYKLSDKELDFLEIDKKIKSEILNMQLSIKKDIEEINQNRVANSVYGKQFNDIFFINKQA